MITSATMGHLTSLANYCQLSPSFLSALATLFHFTCDRVRSNFANPGMTQKTSLGFLCTLGLQLGPHNKACSEEKSLTVSRKIHELRIHTLTLTLHINQTEECKTFFSISLKASTKPDTISQRRATTRLDNPTSDDHVLFILLCLISSGVDGMSLVFFPSMKVLTFLDPSCSSNVLFPARPLFKLPRCQARADFLHHQNQKCIVPRPLPAPSYPVESLTLLS